MKFDISAENEFVCNVSDYGASTVQQFIQEALSEYPDRWGYFVVGSDIDAPYYEYVNGKLLKHIPQEYWSVEIGKVKAYIAKKLINYIIYLKTEE